MARNKSRRSTNKNSGSQIEIVSLPGGSGSGFSCATVEFAKSNLELPASASQCAINRRAPDLERLGNRGRPHAISRHLLDLAGINTRLPALVDTPRLGIGYSFKLALTP